MIKFWFYVVVLLILAVLVLVIGVIFGFILGVYASLLLCLKMWYRAKKAQLSLNKAKKQLQTVKSDNKQE